MKRIILLLFLLYSCNLFCQPTPKPACFHIDCTKLQAQSYSSERIFAFGPCRLADTIHVKKVLTYYNYHKVNEEYLEYNHLMIEDIMDIPIFSLYCGETVLIPSKYEIISLSIWHQELKKTMGIYIRCDHNFHYGEKIKLQNLYFKEGLYFYDMIHLYGTDMLSPVNHVNKYKEKYHKNIQIDISNVKQHEISEEKLAELLQKVVFKIDLTKFENAAGNIEKTFELQTWIYKDGKPVPHSNVNQNLLQFVSTHMYTFAGSNNKGDMVLLKIIHKPSKKEMNVFIISTDYDIKYSSEILLTGMNFIEGCFFYDCMEYYNDWKHPDTIATIDLSNIKEHKISCDKFTKIEYSPLNFE